MDLGIILITLIVSLSVIGMSSIILSFFLDKEQKREPTQELIMMDEYDNENSVVIYDKDEEDQESVVIEM